MTIEIRPARSRSVTHLEGRETFHSFAFGAHYDPANTGFAALTAVNDEHLPPGTGYDDHPHRDVEIVTWVLGGALRHHDPLLGDTVLEPGDVARTSAGSGIVHAEVAASDVPTRFLQTWLRPDESGMAPSWVVERDATHDGLTPVDLGLGVRGARLHLAQHNTEGFDLPPGACHHLYVVSGGLLLGDRALAADDAARLTDEGGRTVVVTESSTFALWSFDR